LDFGLKAALLSFNPKSQIQNPKSPKSIAGPRDWLFQQDNLERGPVST
jgi:hypothetical protein